MKILRQLRRAMWNLVALNTTNTRYNARCPWHVPWTGTRPCPAPTPATLVDSIQSVNVGRPPSWERAGEDTAWNILLHMHALRRDKPWRYKDANRGAVLASTTRLLPVCPVLCKSPFHATSSRPRPRLPTSPAQPFLPPACPCIRRPVPRPTLHLLLRGEMIA